MCGHSALLLAFTEKVFKGSLAAQQADDCMYACPFILARMATLG